MSPASVLNSRVCRGIVPVAGLLLALASCADGPTTADTTAPGVAAVVNGERVHSGVATAAHASPGDYGISATWPSATPYSLSIHLVAIRATGTYKLGTDESIGGGTVVVFDRDGAHEWETPQSGADGLLTITSLTATHITGTFSLTATPYTDYQGIPFATGTAVVSSGSFDVPIVSTVQTDTVPAYFGGTFTRNGLSDVNFSPATAKSVSNGDGDQYLRILATNGSYSFIAAVGPYHGAGTYVTVGSSSQSGYVGLAHYATPYRGSVDQGWSTMVAPGGTASFTITNSTVTRVAGSYTVTFPQTAGSASSPLTVSGHFDIGRFPY